MPRGCDIDCPSRTRGKWPGSPGQLSMGRMHTKPNAVSAQYSQPVAYEHLGVTRWPFPTVPARDFCTFIADRERLRGDLESMLRTLSRQDSSDIHLLWSWFGAGKTHTLFYLANQCAASKQHMGRQLYSVYSEFPKAPKSFVDVYRSFARGLDQEEIIDAYLEIQTSPQAASLHSAALAASPDLVTALQVLTSGTPQNQMTALRWMHGESLPASAYRAIGIQQKIGTTEDAGRIMSALVRLFSLASQSQNRPGCRVVWLLDEFQRIGQLPRQLQSEINVGLHSTFNASPTGLTMVFSFSGKPEKELPSYFTAEMRDRIGLTKVMVLPPLQKEEALTFVRDVLKNLRTLEAYDKGEFFPFTEESAKYIIDRVNDVMDLKPRAIMQAFDAVLADADQLLQQHDFETIDSNFAKQALSERISLMTREEEGS